MWFARLVLAKKTGERLEDWRKLKDYFADAATRLDVNKVNYYVWFHVTLHFMGIKNSAKACNTKSAIACNTKKEPTHVSTIAQKRLVNSVFICIDLNIIQTSPSCLRDLKSLDKKPRLRLGFYLGL